MTYRHAPISKAKARELARLHFPDVFTGAPRCFRVIRFRMNGKPRTIKNGLTEAEAQGWCSHPSTSSHSTGPGAWFDGYDYMKGMRPKES